MINTFRAELVKIRTTRTFVGLVTGTAALVLLQCVGLWWALRQFGELGTNFREFSEHTSRAVIVLGSNASLFTLTLGVLSMTGEFKHATADGTFLAVPNRTHVVLGKAAAALVTGAVIALVASVVSLAIGGPIAASNGYSIEFDGTFAVALLANLYVVGGMAVVGLAVGALVRNQVGAIVGCLAWLLVVENVVAGVSEDAAKFTFDGILSGTLDFGARELLAPGVAALLFGVYLALFVTAAVVRVQRSDVA